MGESQPNYGGATAADGVTGADEAAHGALQTEEEAEGRGSADEQRRHDRI